ncbi:cyclic nucleotide-binding/CBS domain-containing protein [Bacteriovorax sp. Seq25_V]|uniref:CBS domain-containing protein n=1 Tax=Bacteriovorax sp. Seq25_V TaxID=1201288 RepID=UPI00038A4A84|nr:CBS domain-containing protein [Bacteriovorax sp. Seq25_V]EQC44379.1 CBS domain protein [Bacteriovorax sp. Seq25_V]
MTELFEVLEYTIDEISSQKAKYVIQTDPVKKAIDIMRDNRTGCCLVVDSSMNLCGIFTERDVLNYIIDKPEYLDQPVEKFMTRNPQTIGGNESMVIALQMMSNGNFRNLPIVNLEGKPTGMIAISDIMKFIAGRLNEK